MALTFLVALLGILVVGLLRSHADILRALHSLGAGIGDPTAADDHEPVGPVPITMGPTLPHERGSDAPDVLGTTPQGDAVAIAVRAADLTLLAFLTSGCGTCQVFWKGLTSPDALPLPAGTRLVIVTKGPELESPDLVAGLAPRRDVVLSTEAWVDYEVPAAPYFALVDGTAGRRVGEGLASSVEQLAGLIARVVSDGNHRARRTPRVHLDGPEREEDNDLELLASGIRPGDPSLYPKTPHGPAT